MFALLLLLAAGASADNPVVPPRPAMEAVRLRGPVVIDGIPDEEAWSAASPFTAFLQKEPGEGVAPGMKTEVRVAYDDAAIYVAAWMYDPAPDSIVARLGRRDVLQNADLFQLYLDPYRDGRSGFYFGLDPAGT